MNQAGQVNILILDKDEEIQKVFQSVGSQNGYTFDFVDEAYVALLRIVKGRLPDIFFIQPALTGNSAYELCQVASNNKIAVVIMDKEATPEKVTLAARAGAMDFLLKSGGEKIIAGKIQRILEHQGKIAPQTKKFAGIDFGNKELTILEKIDIILEKAQEAVAMPNSVAKVVALCRNEKVGAAEIVMPLASDPALSSLILKRSNSAAYAGVERVKDLKSAVTRIGVKETKNICVAVSVFNLFDKREKSFGFNRFNYWIHCLSTGIIAQWIARKVNFPSPEDALLAGLLHDIGKMILDDYLNQDYQKVIQSAATGNKTMQAAENEILKTTHSFIGGRIAEVWKFHPEITESIKNHHNYEAAFPGEGNSFNLATFVFLGNVLAKAMLLGCGGDYFVSSIPDAVWCKLGFDKTIYRELIDSVYNDLDELFQILNIPGEMHPKKITGKSPEKRILMAGSVRVVNGFARLYLTNQGYRVTLVEEIGKDKDLNYDLIVYDCPETVSPEKRETFYQIAKKNEQLPAVFLQGPETEMTEFRKFHKKIEVLSQPLDIFVFDQVIKKLFSE